MPTLPPPLRGPLSVSRAASFDHLVGRGKQRPWDIEAERFRRLEIDRQIFSFNRLANHIAKSHIKFTDTGEVAIKAEANDGSFHVSVRDTRPGISAADQAKLFQEFQQGDNAITRAC